MAKEDIKGILVYIEDDLPGEASWDDELPEGAFDENRLPRTIFDVIASEIVIASLEGSLRNHAAFLSFLETNEGSQNS